MKTSAEVLREFMSWRNEQLNLGKKQEELAYIMPLQDYVVLQSEYTGLPIDPLEHMKTGRIKLCDISIGIV